MRYTDCRGELNKPSGLADFEVRVVAVVAITPL